MKIISELLRQIAASIEDIPTFLFKIRNRKMVSFNLCKNLHNLSLNQEGRRIRTILDVGANSGQFTLMARYCWPDSQIYSFEPDPLTAGQFRKNHTGDTRVSLHEFALGEVEGHMELRIAKNSAQNSFLVEPGLEIRNTVDVAVHRLDQVQSVTLTKPVMLKIDVQGFEEAVLKGAKGIIHDVDWVILEVALTEHFENGAGLEVIWKQMKCFGFRYHAILDLYRPTAAAAISEMDVLFSRGESL